MIAHAHPITPPPALTWTHLYPSSAIFDCTGGPDWFCRQFAAGRATGGARAGNRVAVLWAADNRAIEAELGDASCAGIAAINCRGLSDARLSRAGFSYIRRFAAIPNLKNARWFVPLDSPAVSSAGLALYTPSRASAKLKRMALRMAMHARLPIWYRDQVLVAQRMLPPIESALRPLFPGEDVRLALSGGAPEGARNRKASALVMTPDGRMRAFVKLANSPIARRILANEAAVLAHLAATPAVAAAAPRPIYTGEVDGTCLLAQTPLQGRPAPLGITAAHRAFLESLQSQQTLRAADTATVVELPSRLDALLVPRPDLLAILEQTLPMLRSFDVPATIIHGDFAPWNLRLHEGTLSAFDWEYGEILGLPLIDEIHYRLQSGWLLEDWTPAQAAAALREFARQSPRGFPPAQVRAIATIYLLDAMARLLGEGYGPEQDVITWHQELLHRWAQAVPTTTKAAVA